MEMILPTARIKPTTENPKFLILFGKPKSGKTTIMSMLDDNLIIDCENGTNYVEAMAVKASSASDLLKIRKMVEDGGCPYKYITIDTATALEEMILPVAADMYRKTPMGKKFDGDDVRALPNGAGYLYIRQAFKKVITAYKGITEHLILIGHTKDRTINRDGKELSENLLDLSGKLERIISADADALGYVYRTKNQTKINFNGGDDLVVEARPKHLRGKDIVIAESDEDGNMTSYWDRVFKS